MLDAGLITFDAPRLETGAAHSMLPRSRSTQCPIGTARQIYEEPTTRFVAEFMGQSIWFSGELERGAAGIRLVTTENLTLDVGTPKRRHARYGVSIRLEHVHLPARPGDANRVPVVVDRVEFFGAELLIVCKLASGSRTIRPPLRSDDAHVPSAGERIVLEISADRCAVVGDD